MLLKESSQLFISHEISYSKLTLILFHYYCESELVHKFILIPQFITWPNHTKKHISFKILMPDSFNNP